MKITFSKILNVVLGLAIAGFIGYKIYILPKFSDGEKAPTFTAELIDGKAFSLDDLNGQYVLLDFWASWCGPCRRESPSLVSLHKDYFGKSFSDASGFDIVSVALETSEKRWKRAIQADNLYWGHHIVELERLKGPIAVQYGVKEIPTKYLLDTNGEVLMVNPTFEELRSFLDEKKK